MKNFTLEDMKRKHREAVVDVYNYFVANSFAAYTDEIVGYDFFDVFLKMAHGYPAVVVKDEDGDVVGFAFLSAFHFAQSLEKTAGISYFILPSHTRQGIGREILERFEKEAREMGVESLLANISSLNQESLSFHEKNGFEECGRFRDVGTKFGKDFDMVWMQKKLVAPDD
jgi:phosphinothricin acetyltransferase